jgi:signal transduction histidine kinase
MKHLPAVGSSLLAVVSLMTLVTSRARHEEERKELKKRAAALQATVDRLERTAQDIEREKDEFLATLSHELRSPLNAMLGWIELLRLHIKDPAQQAYAIDVIERNAHAEVRIVADLLDMARLVTRRLHLVREPVSLQSVVREASNAVSDAATTKGITVHVDSPDDVHVVGDRARLRQVVSQLLGNAVKFTQPAGRVIVTLGRDASGALIRVADTGIGITREMLPRVFDRFRQAESGLTRTYGGLGLGLALVRHLVELHGGTVEADSRGLQQGATFTVRLPYGSRSSS